MLTQQNTLKSTNKQLLIAFKMRASTPSSKSQVIDFLFLLSSRVHQLLLNKELVDVKENIQVFSCALLQPLKSSFTLLISCCQIYSITVSIAKISMKSAHRGNLEEGKHTRVGSLYRFLEYHPHLFLSFSLSHCNVTFTEINN